MEPMSFSLLLGMQAAGMITDWLGSSNQANLNNTAAKLQQQGIEANIYQTRLESENQSIAAMQKLRQNIGTQLAVNAARGTASGAGSSAILFNEDIGNFDADERIRKLNQSGKELALRTGQQISQLQNDADNSKIWSGFASRTINRFPSSLQGWRQGLTDFRQSFGLTSIS